MSLSTKLQAMPEELKTVANRVPGCLSTVHVHAELCADGTVHFQGDSDAVITRGMVAFLVSGLGGCRPGELSLIQPSFIKESGIAASLTPGRNSGFLNMFRAMVRKALEVEAVAKAAVRSQRADIPFDDARWRTGAAAS